MITGDISELVKLGAELADTAIVTDKNIALAVEKYGLLILEDQMKNVPIGVTHKLFGTLGIERKSLKEVRIGAVNDWEGAGWRAHFTEGPNKTVPPQPFIKPAGEKYAAEFARAIITPSIFKS